MADRVEEELEQQGKEMENIANITEHVQDETRQAGWLLRRFSLFSCCVPSPQPKARGKLPREYPQGRTGTSRHWKRRFKSWKEVRDARAQEEKKEE